MRPFTSFKRFQLNEIFARTLLTEAISPASILKAGNNIRRYLSKQTGIKFFVYPELEKFKGDAGNGYGLRLFGTDGSTSVRFNFTSNDINLFKISSFSIWRGGKGYQVDFDEDLSFVKILPVAVNALQGGLSSVVYSIPDGVELEDDADIAVSEETLVEEAGGPEMVADIIDMLAQPNFSKSKVYSKYRSPGYKVINILELEYPDIIQKVGNKFAFTGSDEDLAAMKADIPKLMNELGIVKGSAKPISQETYEADANTKYIEDNADRLTFEEQLDDMATLLRLTISGASNACFIAGRGGVGKTYTAQQILAEAGYKDGENYFLNKGSISSAGLYATLFEHKDGVIVFDDADDVFKDQTSRNLLKGATDTSKTRKLNWNKMGSNVVDPDDMSEAEIIEQGKIPKYFDFTGKIVFISNLKMDQLDPDGALRTRGYMISIDPTDEEVYDFMEKIAPKMDLEEGLYLSKEERLYVVSLLRKGTSKQTANLRKLKRGLNMLAGAHLAGEDISDDRLEKMISRYA